MSRFLFTLWDGGGNVPPVLSVARSLVRRGHDVRVIADPMLRDDVQAIGARHRPWTTAPQRHQRTVATEFVRDFEARTPIGATVRLRDRLAVGPAAAFALDTREELRREPADVVVPEMLLIGSYIAAEAAGVPSAVLVPNIYPGEVAGHPPFGMGLRPRDDRLGHVRDRILAATGRRVWDVRLGDLNELRRQYSLAPVDTVFGMLELPERVLVLTCAAFEYAAGAGVPSNVRYCGPRLDDPGWVEPWTEPPGAEPLVLAALSTTYQGQDGTLRRVLDALGRLPVRGLVTTGPSLDVKAFAAPPNVTVVASAPHAAVLPRASVVVTHAGHGTVIKALANGLPLVCLPAGRDQPDTAQRVVAAGAGLRLRPSARAPAIARAIAGVLADPTYRAAATCIAAAIDADRQNDLAVEELESVAGAAARGPT